MTEVETDLRAADGAEARLLLSSQAPRRRRVNPLVPVVAFAAVVAMSFLVWYGLSRIDSLDRSQKTVDPLAAAAAKGPEDGTIGNKAASRQDAADAPSEPPKITKEPKKTVSNLKESEKSESNELKPMGKELKKEEPKAELPKKEEPKKEEPKAELPKKDEPKAQLPIKKEEPKKEEPKAEPPKKIPKKELPKKEEPKAELPKMELPKEAPLDEFAKKDKKGPAKKQSDETRQLRLKQVRQLLDDARTASGKGQHLDALLGFGQAAVLYPQELMEVEPPENVRMMFLEALRRYQVQVEQALEKASKPNKENK